MITQEFRPKTFKDVAGQQTVINTLKCIVKNPEASPKTLILQGEFGTGKTTCARIFARALNCEHPVDGDACGICESCKSQIENSLFYEEYDSAIIGNVDSIKALRETFYFNSDVGYKVIVIDECHLVSPQAQSALLKVLEETRGRLFFVLCTTNIEKMLPTIKSRSLELTFNLLSDKDIEGNLKSICNKKGVDVPDDIIELIVRRSLGHARNAQMLLDKYFLLGDNFKASIRSAKDDFIRLFVFAKKKNKENVATLIYKLQSYSLVNLKVDYENLILELVKVSLGAQETDNDMVAIFANEVMRTDIFKYYSLFTNDTIMSSFKSDKQFQAAMWLLYLTL